MNAAAVESLRKKILVVYSAGSGVGKSEIAANLAYCLARKGMRTWVLDADTFAPKQDIIFGCGTAGPTFSDFLLGYTENFPLRPPATLPPALQPLPLFLTMSERDNARKRFALQEAVNAGTDIYSRIPEAVFTAMAQQGIDLLIIDTHPGSERLNEVWMGMTNLLLLISRISPVDLENIRAILADPSVLDIAQKLIVFTNVQVDRSQNISESMARALIAKKLRALKEQSDQDPCTLGCANAPDMPSGTTAIHGHAFLYSEKLALFQQADKRPGLFIEKEPDDDFSVNIRRLGKGVMERLGA